MLTVLESINLTTKFFEQKKIESPRLNAELLLASILKLKRLELYLQFERPLTEKEKSLYREMIKKRGDGMPIQYLIGESEFYGENFIVNENVLIPRPETELLVEKIINENFTLQQFRLLDIGTGSGNIPIIIKKHLPNLEVVSIDISEKATEVAKENENKILKKSVIDFKNGDIFDNSFIDSLGKFDIIVSNPPYVSKEEYSTLQKEILNHEPKIAVTDNSNGLIFFKRISEIAKYLLSEKGKIYLEIGKGQENNISEYFNKAVYNLQFVKDYSEIIRIIKAELK